MDKICVKEKNMLKIVLKFKLIKLKIISLGKSNERENDNNLNWLNFGEKGD